MAFGLKIRASVQDRFFDAISLGHDQDGNRMKVGMAMSASRDVRLP